MVTWDPSDYNRHSAAQQEWARELIAKLALVGSERVLDIGCGDGKVTAEIANLVPDGSVVGVDRSQEMVRFASESFSGKIGNVSFRVMDACELAFEDEFDAVFSSAALHWIIDHRPVLQGIGRALVDGGRCLLQMGGRGNASTMIGTAFSPGPVFDRWGRYFADLPFPYGFYGPEEYEPWLAEAGMRPVRLELVPKDMTQPGAEGLIGWMRTTWMPYTQSIPEAERDRFLSEAVAAYIDRYPPDDQGLVHVPMVRLEVEAVKSE